MSKITPRELHDWYLEAIAKLNPESYNPKAKKPYEKLAPEQQFIDKYIAEKINENHKTTIIEIIQIVQKMFKVVGIKIDFKLEEKI